MAILNGMIKKLNGSAGSLTFKTIGGRTVVSEKVTSVRNSRTSAQQKQRMKWANIVHMFAGLSPYLKSAFENCKSSQSDYNLFVKANLPGVPVYLTRSEAGAGGCIAAPYQISQGSLPAIALSGEGASTKTDICLGSLGIANDTTVAEFSQAVVNNNADYNYGDQITFIRVLQLYDETAHVHRCQFSAENVVLDKQSAVVLLDLVGNEGFSSYDVDGTFYLGHSSEREEDGCFAWIHSRNTSAGVKVSTQYLIDCNSVLPDYTSADAFALAADSYGGVSEVFLSPESNNAA